MDMIVNYIEKDPYRIKYPDRDAAFYLNSPQFLNLLNDSGLDLEKQSQNLATSQLIQAQSRVEGRGGAFDTAVDARSGGGSIGSGGGSNRSVGGDSGDSMSDISSLAVGEVGRMREQEENRRQEEERLQQYREMQYRLKMERRVQAAAAASDSVKRTTKLPDTVGAPISYTPFATSSGDPQGSSYQKRLREEELQRVEAERLVSKHLRKDGGEESSDGGRKGRRERGRSRSPVWRKKEEVEMEVERLASKKKADDEASGGKGKKHRTVAKVVPKRQTSEGGEREREKKPRAEYFTIGDIDRSTKEERKEDRDEEKERRSHGTKADTKKSKKYWEKKSNAYIIDQLSLHGVRIDPSLLTGRKVVFDVVKNKNVTEKVKKITKGELLDMLYKELKMS
jgi:hypothetical protein